MSALPPFIASSSTNLFRYFSPYKHWLTHYTHRYGLPKFLNFPTLNIVLLGYPWTLHSFLLLLSRFLLVILVSTSYYYASLGLNWIYNIGLSSFVVGFELVTKPPFALLRVHAFCFFFYFRSLALCFSRTIFITISNPAFRNYRRLVSNEFPEAEH